MPPAVDSIGTPSNDIFENNENANQCPREDVELPQAVGSSGIDSSDVGDNGDDGRVNVGNRNVNSDSVSSDGVGSDSVGSDSVGSVVCQNCGFSKVGDQSLVEVSACKQKLTDETDEANWNMIFDGT